MLQSKNKYIYIIIYIFILFYIWLQDFNAVEFGNKSTL